MLSNSATIQIFSCLEGKMVTRKVKWNKVTGEGNNCFTWLEEYFFAVATVIKFDCLKRYGWLLVTRQRVVSC